MSTPHILAWVFVTVLFIGALFLLCWQVRNREKIARLEQQNAMLQEQVQIAKQTEIAVKDSFEGISSVVLQQTNLQFQNFADRQLQAQMQNLENHDLKLSNMLTPFQTTVVQMDAKLQKMESDRTSTYAALEQKINTITQETNKLAQALHHNSERGQWGELQLRRVVELAGMEQYIDYEQQVCEKTETGGTIRPDMVIKLPEYRNIIIDSKVPMSAYLNAQKAESPESRVKLLQEHAKQLKDQINLLSKKEYQTVIPGTPNFVIMFLPGDYLLQAALEYDSALFEFAIQNKIILATPSSLVALLKTIAFSWQQHKAVHNVQEIRDMGKKLYTASVIMLEHMDTLQKSIKKSVTSFNSLTGSINRTFYTNVKRLLELGVETGNKQLPQPLEEEMAPPQEVVPKEPLF